MATLIFGGLVIATIEIILLNLQWTADVPNAFAPRFMQVTWCIRSMNLKRGHLKTKHTTCIVFSRLKYVFASDLTIALKKAILLRFLEEINGEKCDHHSHTFHLEASGINCTYTGTLCMALPPLPHTIPGQYQTTLPSLGFKGRLFMTVHVNPWMPGVSFWKTRKLKTKLKAWKRQWSPW